jgi:hypothetical protein
MVSASNIANWAGQHPFKALLLAPVIFAVFYIVYMVPGKVLADKNKSPADKATAFFWMFIGTIVTIVVIYGISLIPSGNANNNANSNATGGLAPNKMGNAPNVPSNLAGSDATLPQPPAPAGAKVNAAV